MHNGLVILLPTTVKRFACLQLCFLLVDSGTHQMRRDDPLAKLQKGSHILSNTSQLTFVLFVKRFLTKLALDERIYFRFIGFQFVHLL